MIIIATAEANVNVRIDPVVKERATQILARMGIDQTTAIDMFYRQVIAEHSLPFRPSIKPTLNGRLINALENHDSKKADVVVDENGVIHIDKDKQPELYDWAVNG
ncbi:MAG: type II toxin-antitoxin system RelB/DinJ family antitoxin [Oscillospiraceae bacterium]|nr:type II toxin-antitoxin system RelB/DinJ family antitoxin [Oscillospiraceae bacterium]